MVRRRKSRKIISWVIFLILLIAVGVVCYLVWGNDSKDEVREEDSIEVVDKSGEAVDSEDEDGEGEEIKKEEVVQYDGEDPNNSDELTGVVTYAGKVDDKLIIRVNIDQFLSDGTCELILEKGGSQVHNETANIVDSAATATCEGFDVSAGALGGHYNIIIKMNAGGKQGIINGEISL